MSLSYALAMHCDGVIGRKEGQLGLSSHGLQKAFMGVNLGRASTIPAMGLRLSFLTWYSFWAAMLSSTVLVRCSVGGSSGAERLAIGDGLLGYGLELALISVHVYETILTVYDNHTITIPHRC